MLVRKFRLHYMWNRIAIYGATPEEALTKKGRIPRAPRVPAPTGTEMIHNLKIPDTPVPQPDLEIIDVVGVEETNRFWGNRAVIRVLCNTYEGVVAVDMCEESVNISPATKTNQRRSYMTKEVEQH